MDKVLLEGAGIRRAEGQIATSDGIRLFFQSWQPEESSVAALALLHGYGDHSGRYSNLGTRLAASGYSIFAVDLRGNGRSPGKRGYIDRFTDYLQDASALLEMVRRDVPGVPLFLLGHSMGGLIAAALAEKWDSDVAGIVLSSPFLGISMPVPAWKSAAAIALSAIAPSLTMTTDLNLDLISHDAILVEATRRDPLSHQCGTPRWFTETIEAQKQAIERADSIRAPIAILYAGDDRIADAAATERFFDRLTGPKVKHRYEGYYHEILNEVGRETVIADLESWLASQLQRPNAHD